MKLRPLTLIAAILLPSIPARADIFSDPWGTFLGSTTDHDTLDTFHQPAGEWLAETVPRKLGCPGASSRGDQPALDFATMTDVLSRAGFAATTIPTMLCISEEESGWYPQASCSNTSGKVLAFGVFQIYKTFFEKCTGKSVESEQLESLSDPNVNAACAKSLFDYFDRKNGNGYIAWDVYAKKKNGKCRLLDPSRAAPLVP